MKYDDLHPTLRELLGCHEGFRKMGFPAANLFVEPSTATLGIKPGEMMCFMRLTWRDKVFRIGCGVWDADDWDGLQTQWVAACEAFNGGHVSQEDMDRIWCESMIHRDAASFVIALMNKGIIPPRGFQ